MIFSTEKNKKELKKYYFRSFQIISDHESFDCFDFCSKKIFTTKIKTIEIYNI